MKKGAFRPPILSDPTGLPASSSPADALAGTLTALNLEAPSLALASVRRGHFGKLAHVGSRALSDDGAALVVPARPGRIEDAGNRRRPVDDHEAHGLALAGLALRHGNSHASSTDAKSTSKTQDVGKQVLSHRDTSEESYVSHSHIIAHIL